MYDSSKLISKFHNEHIALTRSQSQDMQRRRDANLERLQAGLAELEKPKIVDTINQGGNAMQTMTQPPEGDEESRYDIDMGVVFEEQDAKTPQTTKIWVRDAIKKKASKLKSDPEAKKKCVRVIYADGYQCDFPVFRRLRSGDGHSYEIAIGNAWNPSDPRAINLWFEDEVKNRSPEKSSFQLRRIVRFIKYFAKVHSRRTKTKFPAGLVATALAVECYQPVDGRDDEALFKTLKVLKDRSEYSPVFSNGVQVSDTAKDVDRIKRLRDAAGQAVDALAALDTSNEDLTDEDAKKAWEKVFRHRFFDQSKHKGAPETKSLDPHAEAKSVFSIVSGVSDAERQRRAEDVAKEIKSRGSQSSPWSC